MKRFPKIIVATCAVVALTSSLALAAEPSKKAVKPAPMQPDAQMGQMNQMGMTGMMGHGEMGPMNMRGLAALSPEKQELAKAMMAEHRQVMFPLHQSLYAKTAELEALNAAGNGDSDKAKSVIRDIADQNAKMLIENGKFRTRMVKETGLRTPVMGHGGMMGGQGMCGQMDGKMGGHPGSKRGGQHSGKGLLPRGHQGAVQHGYAAPVAPVESDSK